METLMLRFSKHERIPGAGDETTTLGMVGTAYRVAIHRILSRRNNETHVVLKVQATRHIIESQ